VKRTKSAVTLIGCLAALAAAPSTAADLNVLREVRLEPTASGARVVVSGTRQPVFTVFRLAGPDRLVIDVASSDASAVRGARDGAGPILGINVSQFTDSSASVGRLLVTLKEAKSYDVKTDGDQLVVSVVGEGTVQGAVASTRPAPAPRVRAADATAPAAQVSSSGTIASAPPSVQATGAPGTDVVSVARDSRVVKSPAHRLTVPPVRPARLRLVARAVVRRANPVRARTAADLAGADAGALLRADR